MLESAVTPAQPRPAASIVIVRDAQDGIETFMLVRNRGRNIAFSGAMVFPGGKVDADDSHEAWQDLAPPAAETPDHPFWIAAVRETFEEAGLLLARTGPENFVTPEHTQRLLARERRGRAGGSPATFLDLVEQDHLTLALDQMVHFGHWITPRWLPKRFDTHFFLVSAPQGQHGLVDSTESSDGFWIAPAEALRQAEAGERTLVDVTRFTLELLDTWPDVAHAMRAARGRKVITISPTHEETGDGVWVRIPEHAEYASSSYFIPRK
ncbi:MAG: NUDIX domain-containing protein [Gammaproteobacteria bacterium]|nr:NUDIX domain-containing protein [Gammaproteobacteria bacterium]